MKPTILTLISGLVCFAGFCDTIPIITTQPQSQTIADGASTSLGVVSSNATGYQWRLNGADISGATNASLQANGQGYYVVIVKNPIGWVARAY